MSLLVNPPQEEFVSNHFLDFYQHFWFCAYVLNEYAAWRSYSNLKWWGC